MIPFTDTGLVVFYPWDIVVPVASCNIIILLIIFVLCKTLSGHLLCFEGILFGSVHALRIFTCENFIFFLILFVCLGYILDWIVFICECSVPLALQVFNKITGLLKVTFEGLILVFGLVKILVNHIGKLVEFLDHLLFVWSMWVHVWFTFLFSHTITRIPAFLVIFLLWIVIKNVGLFLFFVFRLSVRFII